MISILAPAVTFIVGTLGLIGVVATIRQRAAAESAERFWNRLIWALQSATSDDPRTREAGERTLMVLRASPEATVDDARIIDTVIAGNRRHPIQ